MKVVTVPVHEDNYAYLLIDEASKEALVVDPGVPSAYVLLNTNLSCSWSGLGCRVQKPKKAVLSLSLRFSLLLEF